MRGSYIEFDITDCFGHAAHGMRLRLRNEFPTHSTGCPFRHGVSARSNMAKGINPKQRVARYVKTILTELDHLGGQARLKELFPRAAAELSESHRL